MHCRSVGAVAELLDISCFYGTDKFLTIQDDAFEIFASHDQVTVEDLSVAFDGSCYVLGEHYFQPNPSGPATSLSPVFDFRADLLQGDPNAFVLANKVGDIPAPTGSQDVDYLELAQAEGDLAKHVFRVDTRAGQPPSSVSYSPLPDFTRQTVSCPLTVRIRVLHLSEIRR